MVHNNARQTTPIPTSYGGNRPQPLDDRMDPNAGSSYDPTFPKPISLGPRLKAWFESQIDQYTELLKHQEIDNPKLNVDESPS